MVAQIATRRHIPAIATLPVGDAGSSGSWWFTTCDLDSDGREALSQRLGRPPSVGELAGWSAIRIAHLLSSHNPDAPRPDQRYFGASTFPKTAAIRYETTLEAQQTPPNQDE